MAFYCVTFTKTAPIKRQEMCIRDRVKGGFAERKGKQLIPTKNGNSLICILPDMLTSPPVSYTHLRAAQLPRPQPTHRRFPMRRGQNGNRTPPVSYTHLRRAASRPCTVLT